MPVASLTFERRRMRTKGLRPVGFGRKSMSATLRLLAIPSRYGVVAVAL